LGRVPARWRALPLVKAVAVGIERAPPTPPALGLNCLCGTAQRIIRGDGPVEVVVGLGAGVTVRGVTTLDRLEAMGISEQGPACAVFAASSVIIGVDG
jgi:molybdate transport system regulatory protein